MLAGRSVKSMIPNDFIQTLLSRVDIVDVIDRYVPLKKAGANYQACCPFHSEKTPSFTVSPTKQFYHCFGCGAHGTAIGFLMEHGGKTFPDAVEELARDAGLQVPRIERPGESERRGQALDLTALTLDAAKFYRAQLKDAPRAIDYLKERGLTGEIAARFGIGYAPDAWQPLASAFARYDDPALETVGLVIAGDAGKRYDRFRDRIMFPIHDSRGQVIGFGGRVLGEGEPKYLNSPETPLFSKGRELYGLYLARQAIRDAGVVVVVEGYMDVVALAQHGVDYAVATLGTSTTPVHVQKLFRQSDRVVFCFDGDAAGRKAAWRALENALPVLADGKNAGFVFLPDGEDPDDFVRRRGKAAFEALIARRRPGLRVPADRALRAASARLGRGQSRAGDGGAPLPRRALSAPVLAALLHRRLAELTGLPGGRVARAPWSPPGGRSRPAPARSRILRRGATRSRAAPPPVRRGPGSGARRRSSVNSSRPCCSNLNWRGPAPCRSRPTARPTARRWPRWSPIARQARHTDHCRRHAIFRGHAARAGAGRRAGRGRGPRDHVGACRRAPVGRRGPLLAAGAAGRTPGGEDLRRRTVRRGGRAAAPARNGSPHACRQSHARENLATGNRMI